MLSLSCLVMGPILECEIRRLVVCGGSYKFRTVTHKVKILSKALIDEGMAQQQVDDFVFMAG